MLFLVSGGFVKGLEGKKRDVVARGQATLLQLRHHEGVLAVVNTKAILGAERQRRECGLHVGPARCN